MEALKRRAIQGALKVFYAVRMVVVACVCLLLGFSARQLFDAYVPEMISRLTQERIESIGGVFEGTDEREEPVVHGNAEFLGQGFLE